MPEITIDLSLSRSSGVLAGIVGTLARTGIELRRQTLKRDEEGKGGWLAITGEGTPPAPAVVAENLNATRVVDRLLGMVLDGEAVLAQGVPLDDQLAPADPAERYAGSDAPANAMNEETIASEAALPAPVNMKIPAASLNRIRCRQVMPNPAGIRARERLRHRSIRHSSLPGDRTTKIRPQKPLPKTRTDRQIPKPGLPGMYSGSRAWMAYLPAYPNPSSARPGNNETGIAPESRPRRRRRRRL